VDGYRLPKDFASQLERTLAPGEAEEAAGVIVEALRLGDAGLSAFLEGFARRIAVSPEPVRAEELRAMLAAGARSRRSASQRSSQ
jgi:hypothetical protein